MQNAEYVLSTETPVGMLTIRAIERGIRSVDFSDDAPADSPDAPAFLHDAVRQLSEYFGGARRAFTELPLVVAGTEFQQDVWDALDRIAYGDTRTYAQIAAYVDKPGGAQAVGQALTRNPIPIIVPCHRVVPASGETGGYAGGCERKAWLLKHEQAMAGM